VTDFVKVLATKEQKEAPIFIGTSDAADLVAATIQLLVRESMANSTLVRKLATYCLCLLMTSKHHMSECLVSALATHLYAFEQMAFGDGKILINSRLP
jgi:hypothetical protein